MPYLGTVSLRALRMALISSIAVGSLACSDDDGDTNERDGSVNEGENGTGNNGGATSGNNDGTNGSGNSGGATSGNNDGTNGSGGANNNGNANNNGGGTAGTGGTAGGSNGETCGGFAGTPCPDGYFCNVEEAAGGAGCDTADGAGVCQQKPSGCPSIFDPVCSCDIRTHSNECVAHSSGASVLHKGACTSAECMMVGGRVVTSDGASTPECKTGEIKFDLAGGREPTICCVKE